MVGDSGVGKTSILLRFAHGEFKEDVRNTVGVDLQVKMMDLDDKKIKLTIWDTAGQERFRTLTASYYRGAHGIILVYDTTSRESFDNVREWLKEIEIYADRDDVVKMLVGNKIDKESDIAVTTEEARDFARMQSMLFIECSAKTKTGVQQAFEELMHKMMDVSADAPAIAAGDNGNFSVSYDDETNPQQPGCC
jgi:Ras-related protein Rab-18